MSKWLVRLSITATLLQAALIGAIPYLFYDWYLTTPDAGGWACGAQTLAETGSFSDGQTAGLGYNFNICWTEHTYPGLQYFLAAIIQLTQLSAVHLIPPLLILILTITACTMWCIGYRMSGSLTVATAAGLAASITPIALRAFILTPQNLFGYCLISLLLLALVEVTATKRYWWWLVVALLAVTLNYIHILSFGVAGLSCAVWFIVAHLPNWKWRLGTLLSSIALVTLFWKLHIVPQAAQIAIGLFQQGQYTGYDHPIYDHPALLGYGLVGLAVVGLLFGQYKHRSHLWLLICWVVIPLLLGHLSWFGWVLMPDRFVAYMWISSVLLAAFGLERLRTIVPWQPWLWLGFVFLLWGAQLSHAIVYMKDDVNGWSYRFKPHAEFIEAVHWLNRQPDHGVLVGIMAAANREITFAPVWYDGPITSYPWYNLNHRNLKSFKAKSGLYTKVFADPTSAEYLRVQGLYTIIAKPQSPQAKAIAQGYNLAYLIIPKGSQADDIWQTIKPRKFRQIYENARYRIYSLR
ncbi:MAG: hypothetical protein HY565_05825 [Candidatus Kerfeldbacteria bacterium]|nr:hypothetical protein [Candidatus Kerfeldbacteria bacterium]